VLHLKGGFFLRRFVQGIKENLKFPPPEEKDIYEMNGVWEYWLVDPISKSVELYSFVNQRFKLFQYATESGLVKSVLLEGFEIELTDIFQE